MEEVSAISFRSHMEHQSYLISRFLYPAIRRKKGFSQAKNLISFMPPRSSCSSFALLSVHCIVFRRVLNKVLMTLLCIGVRTTKKENPASVLGPKLPMSKPRQIIIWMGAVQNMWKKPQQKSIRETSVDMWLTNLPLGKVCRARVVKRRERE